AMSDEEIVATVKSADEELYTKVSAITGIVIADEESEDDKVLRQGYETAVANVGEDKAAAMSDEEIVATVKSADEELYTKVSAITGIVIADEESEDDKVLRQGYETAVANVGEDKAAAMSDEEIVATVKSADEELYTKVSAITGIVIADEESEDDKVLRQGYEAVVAAVGEDRANELTDYEIVAVISEVDPALYTKVSAITGIVVAAEVAEGIEVEEEDDGFELTLEPTTPAGFLRRACWNKGLRCRKDYGPYYIPVAFVRSKVAVYIDGPTPDNRNDETLRSQSWVVLHFAESKITNGAEEAQIVYDAVKENTRALKKAKAKKKKKR
ncbi:MAG: very short patch repair endonuclease, partial [archaeon]|nr:very short patch repair endonuclease [archaeon]